MEVKDSCCIVSSSETTSKDYWDANFNKLETPNWIERNTPWIMPWIDLINLPKDAKIFCAGVGDSNLVESLLTKGFYNIVANDISEVALNKLRIKHAGSEVIFLQDDLINPSKIQSLHGEIDLYIDRATLHFFTTCKEKEAYFSQMEKLLKLDGYSILGVFNKDNVAKCCGLELQLWSRDSLQNRMPTYDHLKAAEVAFTEINGNVRNYIYQLSQKKNYK
ncbi:class I SAM-dependent methyltransferase [Portibacter lacus]|uniref:Methyltransferase type 11 domain-containing protein n=1 Tax=Portibacter lacus TaxID=1099794 RepID=A0AA37SPU9_9BACT|nr:class I SAM-dependent methyltransferase [Portibacter lacus]GLR17689.1 hypothetical protein GCM10007940_23040 [Portibacter lacus]